MHDPVIEPNLDKRFFHYARIPSAQSRPNKYHAWANEQPLTIDLQHSKHKLCIDLEGKTRWAPLSTSMHGLN